MKIKEIQATLRPDVFPDVTVLRISIQSTRADKFHIEERIDTNHFEDLFSHCMERLTYRIKEELKKI